MNSGPLVRPAGQHHAVAAAVGARRHALAARQLPGRDLAIGVSPHPQDTAYADALTVGLNGG